MEHKEYPETEAFTGYSEENTSSAPPADMMAAIEASLEEAIAREDMIAAIGASVEEAMAAVQPSAEERPAPEEADNSEEILITMDEAVHDAELPEESGVAFVSEQIAAEETSEFPSSEDSMTPAPEETEPVRKTPFDLSILDDPDLDATEEETGSMSSLEETDTATGDFSEEAGISDEAEETAVAIPAEPAPMPLRKGRPKRKKGEFLFGIPQIAVTCVWLAIILVTGVTLGRMLWVCAADILAFGREEQLVTVTVYESDSMEDITNKLHKAGLIRYPGLFNLYASLAVDEGEIKPGIWDLNTVYDYHALVNMMSPSSSRTIVEDVLIPEGFTCRQIFQLLEDKRICTAKDLAEYAANGELRDYWFLDGLERGYEYCLEGYLFPDTYDFYKNSTPRDVLEKLLDNFEYRFDEQMQAQIEALNAEVTGGSFDAHDVVIVASMIEKETANNKESPLIASVIYNRLFNWGNTPAFLNIDASIVYALDGKTDLTAEDLKIESPYNTYTNIGLTPGPISNPGLASLKAALNPSTSNYYFYVLNPAAGEHKFSTTLDEHNAFIASLE